MPRVAEPPFADHSAGQSDDPGIEAVLTRAEELLARSRGRTAATPPPTDMPTLTEVAEPEEEPLPDAGAEPADELGTPRLEMLARLAPALESMVESRMMERLGRLAEHIAESVKIQLESEIRSIVRDAIDQALLSEVERTQFPTEKP